MIRTGLAVTGIATALGLAAGAAQARTVTITFDGGCEALHGGGDVEQRRMNGREGPITFTDPNLSVYWHCSDDILLGDDGWSGKSSLQSAIGETFDVVSLDIGGDHNVVRVLDSQNMDDGEAYWALERGDVERVDEFVLLDILGRRPDGSTVTTQWAPDDPSATSFATFTGIASMTFVMTTVWDGMGSLYRGPDGYWYGCNGQAFRCGSLGYDNLVLRLDSLPTPVPLPTAGWMMVGMLGSLAALRRAGCHSPGRASSKVSRTAA